MRASAETVIERPIEAVWAWASDPWQWPRWQEEVRDVRVSGELSRGSRFNGSLGSGGDTHDVEFEIVERRAPRKQVVRSVAGPFPFEGTLELFEDSSSTRVRQSVDAGPDDALARFLFWTARPLVRRGMRRRIKGQLARLKEMVELERAG
jgi:uncharacterized protein YndB with AHSA1/START domain